MATYTIECDKARAAPAVRWLVVVDGHVLRDCETKAKAQEWVDCYTMTTEQFFKKYSLQRRRVTLGER